MQSYINEPTTHDITVLNRDGSVVPFDPAKVRQALTNAFLKDQDGKPWIEGKVILGAGEVDLIESLIQKISAALARLPNVAAHIEDIQDQVELALMRTAPHKVAAAYLIYREKHNQLRKAEKSSTAISQLPTATEHKVQSPSAEVRGEAFELPVCPLRPAGSDDQICESCQ